MSTTKRRKFLIATHGTLAGGVRSALEIITGQIGEIYFIEAYVGENKSIESEVSTIVQSISSEDELVIFTDLFGGSVTNQMARFARQENIHLIAGFNLALVVEVLLSDQESEIQEIIESAITSARSQIVYVNKMIESNTTDTND